MRRNLRANEGFEGIRAMGAVRAAMGSKSPFPGSEVFREAKKSSQFLQVLAATVPDPLEKGFGP